MRILAPSKNLSPSAGSNTCCARQNSDWKAQLLAVCPYVVVALCLLIPSLVMAGGGGDPLASVTGKAEAIQQAVVKIGRTLFIIAGIFLGYRWTKGSHEARERTEHYIVGLVIGLGIVEIINWFSS